MSELLEIIMVISFGASWPMNAMKAYKACTAKGTSLSFLFLIFFGYIAGIGGKFTNADYMEAFAQKWYVLVFYIINLVMVGINIILYYRNKMLDKRAE